MEKTNGSDLHRTDRLKAEKALSGILPKISTKQLRLLILLAHEFIKKP